MVDIPNTRFINLVDNPAAITYSQFGEAQVPRDPQTGGVLHLEAFRQVSFRIGSTKASSFNMFMGKISGPTLSTRSIGPIDDVYPHVRGGRSRDDPVSDGRRPAVERAGAAVGLSQVLSAAGGRTAVVSPINPGP